VPAAAGAGNSVRGPADWARQSGFRTLPPRVHTGGDRAAQPRAKDRHDDQPALRELIVTDNRVAVVARFARAAEAAEHVVGVHRAVQHASVSLKRVPRFVKIAIREFTIWTT
jgi:hypothetical protein